MRKVLITIAVLVTLSFALANVAKADTCPSGSTNCLSDDGVTFTFTNAGGDGSGGFLVDLTITGAVTSETGSLTSFAVEFSTLGTNATNVTLASGPSGWVLEGQGPNTGHGCNLTSGAHWCLDSGTISFPTTTTSTFVFDVTGTGGAPDTADLMAFQGSTVFPGISTTTGVGGGTSTPEPASMLLLGLGLVGVPFLRRKRS